MVSSFRTTLVSALSGLYAMLLIILSLAFEISIIVVDSVNASKYDVRLQSQESASFSCSCLLLAFLHLPVRLIPPILPVLLRVPSQDDNLERNFRHLLLLAEDTALAQDPYGTRRRSCSGAVSAESSTQEVSVRDSESHTFGTKCWKSVFADGMRR